MPWRSLSGSVGLGLYGSLSGLFVAPWIYFYKELLTLPSALVIIVGFATKGEEFCPAETLQVVCFVDDGPKTDWLMVCIKSKRSSGASWD
jgi:hypothetical protein